VRGQTPKVEKQEVVGPKRPTAGRASKRAQYNKLMGQELGPNGKPKGPNSNDK